MSSKVDTRRQVVREQPPWELDMLLFVINEKPSKRSLETILCHRSIFWLMLFETLQVMSWSSMNCEGGRYVLILKGGQRLFCPEPIQPVP